MGWGNIGSDPFGQQRPKRRTIQQKKKRISRRVETQARKEFRPEIKAARKSVTKLKKQRARDLAAVPKAADYLRSALSQAMGEAKDSGLKGRYLQQTLGELTAMKSDAARMVPLEQRAVRQEYASPLNTARSALATQKSQRAEQMRTEYETRVKEMRTAAASSNGGDLRKEIGLATDEMRRILTEIPPNELADLKAGKAAAWTGMERLIGDREGVNSPAAIKAAIRRLKQEIRKMNYIPVGEAVAGVGSVPPWLSPPPK